MSSRKPPSSLYDGLSRASRLKLWWRRDAKTRSSILVVLLVVVAATVAILLLPRPKYHLVSGEVECMSGRAVQGVYIHDQGGGHPGNSNWHADPRHLYIAGYQYYLTSGSYAVSVGCGGTRKKWGPQPHSDVVTGSVNNFKCFDGPNLANPGTCETVKSVP
jgi:hypothetical protein